MVNLKFIFQPENYRFKSCHQRKSTQNGAQLNIFQKAHFKGGTLGRPKNRRPAYNEPLGILVFCGNCFQIRFCKIFLLRRIDCVCRRFYSQPGSLAHFPAIRPQEYLRYRGISCARPSAHDPANRALGVIRRAQMSPIGRI